MLFAPTLADKAILPRAWGGRYFFNRIGRLRAFPSGYIGSTAADYEGPEPTRSSRWRQATTIGH
ncbi:hypothetical protein GFL09_22630 [Pseudomonas stutzeri]|nr:hypothetical protein [Stutzerimonas stutzeri]